MHQRLIQTELDRVESEHRVKILFAIESGSRSWGFESTDSDWDIRYVYVRPVGEYLRIDPRRDVIEEMRDHDIDLVGWDLPKALGLLRKANPSILEWLHAESYYRQDDEFMSALGEILPTYTQPWIGFRHYLSMATSNFEKHLTGDIVSLKKYLYVLRPIMAAKFIVRFEQWPPMLFQELVDSVVSDSKVLEAIAELLVRKRAGVEVGKAPPVAVLHEYIQNAFEEFRLLELPKPNAPPDEPLNALFQRFAV